MADSFSGSLPPIPLVLRQCTDAVIQPSWGAGANALAEGIDLIPCHAGTPRRGVPIAFRHCGAGAAGASCA